MKKLSTFLAGAITALILSALTITALAASGTVSFNTISIAFNGQVVSKAGDGYTLPSGQEVPSSILYTDENGGGTTYLPVRRVSELLSVDIEWNAESGAVEIVGEGNVTTQPSQSELTTIPKFSELTYDEFRELLIKTGEFGEKLNDEESQPKLYHIHISFPQYEDDKLFMDEFNKFFMVHGNEYLNKLYDEFHYIAPYNMIVIHLEYKAQDLKRIYEFSIES